MELKKNEIINEEIESDKKLENEEEEEKDNSEVNFEEENINEEDEETKGNEDEIVKQSSSSTSPKKRMKRITYITFDAKYDYNSHYFYQELKDNELKEITNFIEKFLSDKSTDKTELITFFSKYPNIIKGNVEKLKEILNQSSEKYPNLSSYRIINDYIITEYYTPKPSICECYFFPDGSNEHKVVNMLRTCKKSLDIAIYTLTLESITKAIIEVYNRGIPVRIICDNECEKKSTSKIKKLAAIGIVCKTDNSRYYMHHKVAIIDNSVIITGSFNWSSQAVNHNQENVLFYENKEIAQKYTDEFNNLWNNFETVINKEEAIKYIENKEEMERKNKEKLEIKIKKQKERLLKKQEKEKEKAELLKQKEMEKLEKAELLKQKEMEKLEKKKEREQQKLEKQKQKEIEKLEKQKKDNQKIEKQKKNEKDSKEKVKRKIKTEKQKEKEEKEVKKITSKTYNNKKNEKEIINVFKQYEKSKTDPPNEAQKK